MPRRSVLSLTSFALATALASRARADVTHVYTRGETFAGIAERYYGNAALEPVIVAANFIYVQSSPTLSTGVHLTIPTVRYVQVSPNDTWERLANRYLGDGRRGPYLARINSGVFNVPPSTGAVVRLPYLLRYIVTTDEPLFELARRFYGDRSQVQFITEFNHLSSQRVTRNQVLLLPLADVVLRDRDPTSPEAVLVAAHSAQRQVARDVPVLEQYISRGLWVEAVGLGARLASAESLSISQRVAVNHALAVAYAALDRRDLAADAFRAVLSADPNWHPDPELTSPKVLDAWLLARGSAPSRVLRPAPPTSRPDEAH